MMNATEMNTKEMDMVNGGTFTRNTLTEERYNEAGITTKYHTFAKDEFWLPDGTKTDMAGADAYVKQTYGEETTIQKSKPRASMKNRRFSHIQYEVINLERLVHLE